ncbi:class I SAM-dependent methyltransferase [Actinomycetospora chiangmaiensis]|uniref:class I SAM-dependent methyltransferase n=1 Tax=Actinomycetospora chiangmaiensis TaxID=402650 RepID=UPI0003753429|nr:class I SAM-dependent methyltransferase [Actinomycetospora chiangmaiensis]
MATGWFITSADGWQPRLYETFFAWVPWGRRLRRQETQPISAVLDEYVAPGTRVLEIGPGTGAYTGLLADAGVAVEVREPSPSMRDFLVRRAARKQWANVVVADGCLPRPLNVEVRHELVIAIGVLNYIDDLGAAFAAMNEALEPHGAIVCNVPTGERAAGARYRFIERLGRRRVYRRTRSEVARTARSCNLEPTAGPIPAGVTDLYVLTPLRPSIDPTAGAAMTPRIDVRRKS